jgi:hypothetical protein
VTAREIAADDDLHAIAAAGIGFVVTPFNRRWHTAKCAHVQAMTVGTRKWFAATPTELADYLQHGITQYDTAKPIEACWTTFRSRSATLRERPSFPVIRLLATREH